MQLENKTVFVTGTNKGIGKALIEALLERGAQKIYAAARKPENISDFGNNRVVKVALDITNQDQVLAAAQEASDTEILINNAGVAAWISILDGPMELIRRDMETNYYGTLNMMRAFLPMLENKKTAAIINVASITSFVNFPLMGGYSASKAALFSLTQGARIELAGKHIRVHNVIPGPIDTDMAKDFNGDKTSPIDTAKAILNGLESDEADSFPDPGGQSMFAIWKKNYRDLEFMVADMAKVN